MTIIDREGSETESQTSYASCREYASKTRMLFDSPPAVNAPSNDLPPIKPAAPAIPAGLHFRSRILSTIDSATAAAGDPIEAVLLSPIRDKGKKILAPAGALLHARLAGFEQRPAAIDPRFQRVVVPDLILVSVQLESIELNGKTVPMHAEADPLTTLSVSVFRRMTTSSQAPPEDASVFVFHVTSLHLKKLEWSWTTLPQAPENK